MSGEVLHEIGREGAVRAKRWLEGTTRFDVSWVNPDAVAKLTFPWATTGTFSFDLGGTLRGGSFAGTEFFAEVKKYSAVGEQPEMYREYLAKCYRAYMVMPARCDHFFWLTWHPFSQSTWAQLCTAEYVRDAVIKYADRCLGAGDEAAVVEALDAEACKAVSQRLWLIVLSDKQEDLVVEDAFVDAVFAARRQAHA